MEPGRYIILPCAFKPGDEGDFLLRIFTEKYSEERYISLASFLGFLQEMSCAIFTHSSVEGLGL